MNNFPYPKNMFLDIISQEFIEPLASLIIEKAGGWESFCDIANHIVLYKNNIVKGASVLSRHRELNTYIDGIHELVESNKATFDGVLKNYADAKGVDVAEFVTSHKNSQMFPEDFAKGWYGRYGRQTEYQYHAYMDAGFTVIDIMVEQFKKLFLPYS